ncbi:MAG: hypothetical protein IJ598_05295 [Ruminococcus sp.]|nr:hypothetical protein [Ruminococcus sp.]
MTEIEIIARAQMYLEKLANGVNPLTDEEVAENDVVNHVRISRCLFYTSGILKQIVDNKGKFKVEMPDRAEFCVTAEQLANYEYSERPISITEVTKRINALINTLYVKEIKSKEITGWLVEIGMLTNIVVNNNARKRPTSAGQNLGITTEERVNQYGIPYEGVFYHLNAQHFIIDNIHAIIESSRNKAHKES